MNFSGEEFQMSTRNTIRIFRIVFFAVLLSLSVPASAIWAQASPVADDSKKVDDQGHKTAAQDAAEADEEDWSTLLLPKGVLRPSDPLQVELDDDNPAFTREYLSVHWRIGDPIHLFVIKPKGVKKPPLILHLFSYPSETDRFFDDDVCKFLTKDGFAAVGFVSALTGHRYHDRPMREWFISELQEALGTSVHDVQIILNYLSTRDDLDMDRVGMFGDGSGATIAILTSAVDPRLKALDLIDPWGDWPNWLAKSTLVPENERADYLKPEFLKKVAPLDPVQWLPNLKAKNVRLQEVMDVKVTPSSARERIDAAAPPTIHLVRYDDRKSFLKEAVADGKALDWLKQQVKSGDAQKYSVNSESTNPGNLGGTKSDR
jgi:hypothetical protein